MTDPATDPKPDTEETAAEEEPLTLDPAAGPDLANIDFRLT